MSVTTIDAEAISLTHEEVVRRARGLAPMLREHAHQVETDPRIANETIEAIVGAGLTRILQPRKWGGYEISH